MKQNKIRKIVYVLSIFVIIIGIIVTYIWKTNFSLMSTEHTRIDLYLDNRYQKDEIAQMVTEVFGNQTVEYQEIETFGDSIAIHVKQASEEQINALKEKISTKYEIEEVDSQISVTQIPHERIIDRIKPYMIPMIITTLVILAYIGIRYLNLGMFQVIGTTILRLFLAEGVLLSIIQIVRIPVSVYTIPVGIIVYMGIILATIVEFEKKLAMKKQEND